MADARMLSKKTSLDAALNQLPLEAHLVYLQSIPHLDRDGLLDGRPNAIFAASVPLRTELLDKIPGIIQSWIDQNLVIRYEGGDGPILYFKGFRRHNSRMEYTKERPSQFPPPPGWSRHRQGLVPNNEEECLRLSEFFKPESHYYRALVEAGKRGREEVERRSRVGREKVVVEVKDQDQVKDQDEDQDQDEDLAAAADCAASTGLTGKASRPGTIQRSPRANTDDEAFRQTCLDLAQSWGYGTWDNFETFLDSLLPHRWQHLAEWMYKFTCRPDLHDRIRNPAGFLYNTFSDDEDGFSRAGLSPDERQRLNDMAAVHAAVMEIKRA